MKSFIVALSIVGKGDRLAEISRRIGVEASASSHEIGSPRGSKLVWDETLWRLESGIEEGHELAAHCVALMRRLATVGKDAEWPSHWERFLEIGVFTENLASCTVRLPAAALELALRFQLEIEISFYPA